MMKRVLLIFLLTAHLHAGSYQFEGVFNTPDGDERLFLVGQFVPYDPNILIIGSPSNALEQCAHWLPKGSIFAAPDPVQTYDVVWVDSDGAELDILQGLADVLHKTSVIYTSTHLVGEKPYSTHLKPFLESSGFALLSHWYWEQESGHAIFVKKQRFDAAMRALNYCPTASKFVDVSSLYPLKRLFRKAVNHPAEHRIEAIDFIYMINLDERPEKFARAAAGLRLYGISPYRFSAVNGWNLSFEAIDQIGVKCASNMLSETLMGSLYYHVDGNQYRSNELIESDGRTYFSLGMSRGAIGIVLSHLSVLQDALDAGYDTIWVMEDDVEAVADPLQIPHLIHKLDAIAPDWDILFTDTDTKNSQGVHVPCRALAARPNFCQQTLDQYWRYFYTVNDDFSRIGMRYGAYSMIVRKSGMEKILRYFQMYGIFLPYDMDFWQVPEIKLYKVNRDIVSHAAGSLTDNNLPHYLEKK